MQKLHFDVTGMSCAACSARVEKAVKALDGCCNVTVNLLKNDMTLELDDAKLSQDDVVKAVTAAGYGASLRDNDSTPLGQGQDSKEKQPGRGPAAGIDGHAQAPLLEPLFLRASDGDHDAADGWHHVLLF